jgi:signal transduction histidine kinase/ActR/RegA family two-component response regulator
MSKKKLQNRLNTLFAELKKTHDDQQFDLEEKVEELTLTGKGGVEGEITPESPSLNLQQIEAGVSPMQVITSEASALGKTLGQSLKSSIMSVPVSINEKQDAVIEIIDENQNRVWDENERRLVDQVKDHLTLALENAYLFQETQAALAETDRLYQASSEINAVKSYTDVLAVLRQTILSRRTSIGFIKILMFDHPWQGNSSSGKLHTLGTWIDPSWKNFTEIINNQSLSSQPNAVDIFKRMSNPDYLVSISDVSSTEILPIEAQQWYTEVIKASGVLFVPLTVGGQWIGLVEVAFKEKEFISNNELRSLYALASQIAVALQNLRLLDETRRRASQLEIASEIARDATGTLQLNDLLNRSVQLIYDRYNYYHVAIYLLDSSGMYSFVRAAAGPAAKEMIENQHRVLAGSNSVLGQAIESGRLFVINDVAASSNIVENSLLPESHSEIVIPLKLGERLALDKEAIENNNSDSVLDNFRVLGVLDVHSKAINAFSEDEIAVLQILVDQLAVAVDNTTAYELAQQAIINTRQRVQELSTIYTVSQALSRVTMQSSEIAHTIVKEFVNLFDVDRVSLLIHERDENLLRVLSIAYPSFIVEDNSHSSLLTVSKTPGSTIQLDYYPAVEHVMQTLHPLIVHKKDELFPKLDHNITINNPDLAEVLVHQFTQTLILIPLAVKGHSIGIIQMESRQQEPGFSFSTTQNNLAMTLANAAAGALENAQLYEEQLETSEKLRELDKLKSQFLANMSHELRTPLNSIIGFSRVILKGIDGPISEVQQQDLTAIHNAGTHLLELINDVLDISKIEAGKMELAFDDGVYIPDLVNSALSTAVGLTKDKPIRLEKIIEPDLPLVRADPTRIRQVLINFLSNAAKFTEKGVITVRAYVSHPNSPKGSNQPEIIISVTDTGSGISPEDQIKLFKPFSQVDSSPTRKVGGSGLGLSISRLLVELHGGRIGIESELGHGTTFFFSLPLQPNSISSLSIPIADELKETGASKTIMIVEDDPQVVKLYERYLVEHHFQIVPVTDPTRALAIARDLQPFAITLDIMMPCRDGWQVLEELKKDPETSHIPVIVCSIVEDLEKGLNLGAVDYLIKPVLDEDLLNAIVKISTNSDIHDLVVIDDDPDELRLVERALASLPNIKIRKAKGGALCFKI